MPKEKWKGKDWYEIVTPKFLGENVIGDTLSIDATQLKGRVIEASLMEITGDPGKYYIKLFFKITDIDGNKALTIFFGHDCTRDFVARIVQVRTTRIDTNSILDLKDGRIRLKTIAITNRKVPERVVHELRKFITETLKKSLSNISIEEFVKDMISRKTQEYIKNSTSKIYPLRFFEFRKSEIISHSSSK